MIIIKGCTHCQGDLIDGTCLQCSRDAPNKVDEDQIDAANMDFITIITAKDNKDLPALMQRVNERRKRLNERTE